MGTKTKVVRIPTSPEKLESLLNVCRQHKQNVMQNLLKQEYKQSQQAQKQKMLKSLNDGDNTKGVRFSIFQ